MRHHNRFNLCRFFAVFFMLVTLLPFPSLGDTWKSYPNQGRAIFFEQSESWLLLATNGLTADEVEHALSALDPAVQLTNFLNLTPNRIGIELAGPRTLTFLARKHLLSLPGIDALWPGAKRGKGIGFFDNQLVIHTESGFDAHGLRKLGIVLQKTVIDGHTWTATTRTGDAVEAAWKAQGVPGVVWAEPDLIRAVQLNATPNDRRLAEQWHLEARNDTGDIDAAGAWDYTMGHPDVVVSIFDNGFDMEHPDLVDAIIGGFDAVDGDRDPSPGCVPTPDGLGTSENCPPDRPFRQSHGTAVAGLAAARGDNKEFGTGVCPRCSLHVVRMLSGDGTRAVTNAVAFNQAAEEGAWVINNSWGPSITRYFPLSNGEHGVISRVSREARDGLGVLLVFAAGNDYFTPADSNPYTSHPDTLTVAASTRKDDFACYSNYGQFIDIAAPSKGCFNGEPGLSTTDIQGPEGYNVTDFTTDFGGTSAASPVAAGLVGLVLSAVPDLTAQQVRIVLHLSSDKILANKNNWEREIGTDLEAAFGYDDAGFSMGFGYGRINAERAVRQALQNPPQTGAVCGPDCPQCHEERCAPHCTKDEECPGGSRCRPTSDGGRGCMLPKPAPTDAGEPCNSDCEFCIETANNLFRRTEICTNGCATDDDCRFGFDCRTLEAGGPRACVPGNAECGSPWGQTRCWSDVRVDGDGAEYCSCDCLMGTQGACPDGFICSNVTCRRSRGAIICQPAQSSFEANYPPHCIPDPDVELPCNAHADCSSGMFCIDGTCAADRGDGGCDICTPCTQNSDCNSGEECVDVRRGKRCMPPCVFGSDDCPGDSACVNLPGLLGDYCINPDHDRKGICPRAWKCVQEDRCVSDEDCSDDTCIENVCGGPEETIPESDAGLDEPEPPPLIILDRGSESTGSNSGCSVGALEPNQQHTWPMIFMAMLLLGALYRLRRSSSRTPQG